jgi:hypothetical protein
MGGKRRWLGGGAEHLTKAGRSQPLAGMRPISGFFPPKGKNVSGDGDTCRRIDATAPSGRAIIVARGWTVAVASRYAETSGLVTGARVARGDHRLRIAAAALKASLGIVALSWAVTGFAASAGTASAVVPHGAPEPPKVPSIRLLNQQTGLAGTCGGSAFDVNTFISVDTLASADVKVTAPGVGLIEEFTDETGTNIGPYSAVYPTFHILAFGGGLAPNTPITITITTYTGPSLSGKVSDMSTLVFDCTTGVIAAPVGTGMAAQDIPALQPSGLAATAVLLALLGAVLLRRRVRRNARR